MVKLKVKSHVQQERNMAGVGNKFAPLPPILAGYVSKVVLTCCKAQP